MTVRAERNHLRRVVAPSIRQLLNVIDFQYRAPVVSQILGLTQAIWVLAPASRPD